MDGGNDPERVGFAAIVVKVVYGWTEGDRRIPDSFYKSMTTSEPTPEQKRELIAKSMGIKSEKYFRRIVWIYGSGMNSNPPDYFTDANSALTLCAAMADKGWRCSTNQGLDKTWECEFTRPLTTETNPDDIGTRDGERFEIIYGSGKTQPSAICEAYAKAQQPPLW